jgi:hypothetical protein
MTDDDVTVAMPDATGRYQTGTIAGDGPADLARLPPERDDHEPSVRRDVASCSEAVASLRATRSLRRLRSSRGTAISWSSCVTGPTNVIAGP